MENRTTFIIIALIVVGVFGAGGIFLFWELHQPLVPRPIPRHSSSASSVPSRAQGVPADRPLGHSPTGEAGEAIAQPSPSATITFAADFSNNDGCDGHSNTGCDVYTATIQLDGTVSDVTQQTTNDVAEVFPVFSADKKTVYANYEIGDTRGNIIWATLADHKNGTLKTDARGPAPLPDGKSMAFIALDGTSALMTAALSTPTSLATAKQVSPAGQRYSEPHASSLGDIVFYQLTNGGRGSNTAQGGVYSPSTGTFTNITEATGYAHCFWGFGGTSAYCNNREVFAGIQRIPWSGGVAGAPVNEIHHPKVSDVAALDPDYAQCLDLQYAYGSFCDATHLIATLGCATKVDGVSTTTMSKLALVDLSSGTPTYIPLGKNLSDAFGGAGTSSYTASCSLN